MHLKHSSTHFGNKSLPTIPQPKNQHDATLSKAKSIEIRPSDLKRSAAKRIFKIGDRSFTLYSLGWLAYLTNKDIHTLRRYEYGQILPPPVIKSPDGKRWYFAQEIATYANIIKNANIVPGSSIRKTGVQEALFAARNRIKAILQKAPEQVTQKFANEDKLFDYIKHLKDTVSKHRIHLKFSRHIVPNESTQRSKVAAQNPAKP